MALITNDTLFQYAREHHENPFDLKEDLRRISYVKRLLTKEKHDEHRQLILNHLQILYNAFGRDPAIHLLHMAIDRDPEKTWLQGFLAAK